MANSVHWHGHILMREASYVLGRALHLKDEGETKKWSPKRTWSNQVAEEIMKTGLCG